MFVQLPNGKTVDLDPAEYLDIPDDKIDDYLWKLAYQGRGTEINNPFSLSYSSKLLKEELEDCEECPELPDDEIELAKKEFDEHLDFEDFEED